MPKRRIAARGPRVAGGGQAPPGRGAVTLRLFPIVASLLILTGCGGDDTAPTGPVQKVTVRLTLEGVPAWDTVIHGPFQAWFVDEAGVLYAGDRFALPDAGAVEVTSPIPDPAEVMLSLEPPGDPEIAPTQLKFLGGRFVDGAAEMSVRGYLTPNLPLEEAPGVHVLGTFAAYGTPDLPQNQDAGLWFMNPTEDTLSGDYYQDLTPLTQGWVYEGWIVRDMGSPHEVWMSYGKFRPDGFRQVRFRDDTGLGPFSGKEDWERALPFEARVPGDDWIANPLGYPLPAGIQLPLDLNGSPGVPSRWTHVITIEPYEDRDEDPWDAAPMFIRPYRNAIGEGPPDSLRTVLFTPEELPRGTATVLR